MPVGRFMVETPAGAYGAYGGSSAPARREASAREDTNAARTWERTQATAYSKITSAVMVEDASPGMKYAVRGGYPRGLDAILPYPVVLVMRSLTRSIVKFFDLSESRQNTAKRL